MISGYVITSSLAGRESKNLLDFLTGFYERRVKRLAPALAVFVLITSILISIFNPDPRSTLGLGWRSLFGISNISLYKSSVDYFSQSTELNPFMHTWSLGVEEQFYMVFPIIFWLSGFGRKTTKASTRLFLMILPLTIASLMSFIYLYEANQPAAYFLIAPRFWEMATGCIIYITFQKRAKIEQALEKLPPLLVVAAMVGVMLMPTEAAVNTTVSIVILSAALLACLKPGTAAHWVFTREKFVYVGLTSYSLYLWHWTVISIGRWTIGISYWTVIPLILLMTITAVASYEFIEKPTRNGGWFQLDRRSRLAAGIILLAGSAAVTKTIIPIIIRPIDSRALSKAYGATWKDVPSADICHVDGKLDELLRKPIKVRINTIMQQCTTPAKDKPRLYIAGNSHAAQLFGLHHLLSKKYQVTAVTVGWCPFLGDSDYSDRCPKHRQIIQDLYKDAIISNLKQGDLVIISNRFTRGDKSWDGLNPKTWLSKSSSSRVRDFHEQIRQVGGRLLVMSPLPEFGALQELKLCRKLWYRPAINSDCSVAKSSLLKDRKQDYKEIRELKKSGIEFIDIFDSICSAKTCEVFDDDGGNLYSDASHLSDLSIARYLHPKLEEILDQ